MYAPNMRKRFIGLFMVWLVACGLASCNSAATNAASPVPESEQVVSAALKELYLAASAAAPQSPAQQKVILRMANKASNGKELLLVMRAAVGVFPASTGWQEQTAESQVRSTVTAKMMKVRHPGPNDRVRDAVLRGSAEYPALVRVYASTRE